MTKISNSTAHSIFALSVSISAPVPRSRAHFSHKFFICARMLNRPCFFFPFFRSLLSSHFIHSFVSKPNEKFKIEAHNIQKIKYHQRQSSFFLTQLPSFRVYGKMTKEIEYFSLTHSLFVCCSCSLCFFSSYCS